MSKTIKIQMNWTGGHSALLLILKRGDAKGQRFAQNELRRMAMLADCVEPLVEALKPFAENLSRNPTEDEIRAAREALELVEAVPMPSEENAA